MQLTNPSHISQIMFDQILRERFQENPDDESVRGQASRLMQLVSGSRWRDQIMADILHAVRVSGRTSVEQMAMI